MSERNPDRTRADILAAALEEFAAVGPAGARVDRIAAAAGVNKRMLYHYFGSKDGLFAAVCEAQLERAELAFFKPGVALSEQLADAVRVQSAAGPWMRLLVWAALSATPQGGTDRAEAWRRAIDAILEAQTAGELAAELDSSQLLLALVGLVLFPIAFPQLTVAITGRLPSDDQSIVERSGFAAALGSLIAVNDRQATQPKPRYRLTPIVTRS